LHTHFPDVETPPATRDEILAILKEAQKWAVAVNEAYGSRVDEQANRRMLFHMVPSACEWPLPPPDEPVGRPSLWPFFVRPLGEQWVARFKRADLLALAERTAKGAEFVRVPIDLIPGVVSGSVISTADVLGDPPSQFVWSGAYHMVTNLVPETLCALDGLRLPRPISAIPENWPKVQELLRIWRVMVVGKSLSFVAWVRSRTEDLEAALLPNIRFVRDVGDKRVELEVRLAGTRRLVVVPDAEFELLDLLSRQETVDFDRPRKKLLVDRIPEIAPWIQCVRAGLSAENKARYSLPPAVQARIQLSPARA
jgi:hypothetical protein